MSASCIEKKPWTNGKWTAVVVFILAAQVILVLRLSSPAKVEPLAGSPQKTWWLLSAPPDNSRWSEAFAIHDPTFFAHGHALGFSGEAWLSQKPISHRLTDWTNPPFWLKPVTNSLGVAFRTYVQTNLPNLAGVAAATEPPVFKLPAAGSLLATQSVLSVEGELARWLPQLVQALPLIAQTEFITNSVVEVLADAKGRLLSHTLLSSSGSRVADELALERARMIRWLRTSTNAPGFSRTNAGVVWGKLVFHWLTAPATNPPNAGVVSGPGS